MKIGIITDGNNQLGMGHVYQSISFANFLLNIKDQKIKIFFITQSDDKVINLIKESGLDVLYCANDQEIFNCLSFEKPDRIIFDKLDVNPDLAKRIKNDLKTKLTLFTNLTDANKYADITIMAGMGSSFKNIYKRNIGTGKVEFWGPKYWIIRPEFYDAKKKSAKGLEIKSILLLFGGSDQANLSTLVANQLLKLNESLNISIVLGAAFQNQTELDFVISSNKTSNSKVQIIRNSNAVSKLMAENDLAFVSPGLSFFESLLVGTPVICFHQNDFQKEAWKDQIKTYDKSEVSLIPKLLEEKKFIYPTDNYIKEMNIGLGVDEIAKEILI